MIDCARVYTLRPKPQGGGINLRRYKQPSTVIRIICVPRRVGGRCTVVTKHDCVNRGLTISEGARTPTDDPSLGGRGWRRRRRLISSDRVAAGDRKSAKVRSPFFFDANPARRRGKSKAHFEI